MKKIYLLLLFCCIGSFAATAAVNITVSTPTTIASANVCPGATNVNIYTFRLAQGGGGFGNNTVTAISFNINGASTATLGSGDVLRYKLWRSAGGGAGTLLGTITAGTSFTGLSEVYNTGINNTYWITMDVAGSPTNGHALVINAIATGNITASGGVGSVNGFGLGGGNTHTINTTPAAITGNQQMCASGATITLSDATLGGTWGTSGVASVNANTGVVTPGGTQGTTTITYYCGSTATVTATVNATPAAVTGNAQMCTGGSTITLANTSTNGTWSSSNGSMAAAGLTTGIITPGATQGTPTITYDNGCGTAVVTATVNATPGAFGGNSQMCASGSTITLTNSATNGTWSGGNTNIATVTVGSYTGTVTPGATQGTTTFTYSNGCGSAASVTSTVNATPATITGNAPLCSNGTSVNLANTSTNGTWSSSNAAIASVNTLTGHVTSGVVGGTTTITYSNGCSPAASLTFTVNAVPLIQTFTGGGAFCAGDPGVHIGLTLSQTGVSYQLYNGGTSAGTAVAGTGSAIDFGLYSTIGVYHAIATNTVTLCSSYLPGVTISINPLPDTFTVTGGGSYCAAGTGVHVGMDSSSSGINYQLYNGGSPVGSAMPGTGHPLDFGLQTGAGVYTVMASNAITMCPQAMAGSATVTVIPLPTADTVTGGGGYCVNDSGKHVGLNNSTAGVIYQLYKGGSPIGTPDTSAGGAIDFGFQTLGGIYTVMATDPVTTCSSMMTGSVTVTVNPLPDTFAITGGGSYCAGGSGVHIGLSGSAHGIRYQLYNGAAASGSAMNGTGSALDFGLITAAGVYKVVATDTTTHCMNAKNDSAIVTITPLAITHLRINTGENAGDTVCGGGPVTFTAQTLNGGTSPTYQWNVENLNVGTNDSTYTYTPSLGNFIAVTMISSAACAVPDTLYDTMRIQIQEPLPPSVFILVTPINTIHLGQPDTLIAIPTNCGYAPRYQWFKNGNPIAGATNAMYTSSTFANHDSVSVRVFTNGACGGHTTDNSVIITVYPASVAQVTAGSDIKLIPNPNRGEFMIRGTLNSVNDETVSVEMTNMMGQVIYKNQITAPNGVINEKIQLSNNLATGMYILNLKSSNETNVFRVVIEQ